MSKLFSVFIVVVFFFVSCSGSDPVTDSKDKIEVVTPPTYDFKKDGVSTVSYSGQIVRLKMLNELKSALGREGLTKSTLQILTQMFKDGKGFASDELNNSGKKLRETVASATNTVLSTVERESIQIKLDTWIKDHANNVIKSKDIDASEGIAGHLSNKRYVNSKGIEINQAVAKTSIGAIILDQTINKYLSKKYLDDARKAHEEAKPYKEGKNYTKLEHGWDEAYGYIFGEIKEGKIAFLGKYLAKVDTNDNFKGILNEVNVAFRRGRQAIVVKNYEVMHQQAAIIRKALSKVIPIRAVHYLIKGKGTKNATTLHELSEGYGFVYALMFAHVSGNQLGYEKVLEFIKPLEKGNGLWSVSDDSLNKIANQIAQQFGFKVTQAI